MPKSNMLRVSPLPAFSDNYIWVIQSTINTAKGQTQVVVVDPGDANVVVKALQQKNWALAGILITHHHHDHIGGLMELKNTYNVPVFGPLNTAIQGIDFAVIEGDQFTIKNTALEFSVIELPGHTLDHIAFIHQDADTQQQAVFCGDTLFSAGCGRMFEGTPEQFSASLNKLSQLANDCAVYCTHEYTVSNLNFAAYIEPDNHDIQQYREYAKAQRIKNQVTLPSSIALELKINPFLHCTSHAIQKRVSELSGFNDDRLLNNPVQTFAHMRQLKDRF